MSKTVNIPGTNVPDKAKVEIIANKGGDPNDDCLIGYTGVASLPFDFGHPVEGYIGIKLDKYGPYGFNINVLPEEIKIIN